MTRYEYITKKCAYCGSESEQTILLSMNETGYPTLDCRPQRMGEDPIYVIIDKCPYCKYTAFDISEEIPGLDSELLKSKEFKDIVEKFEKQGVAGNYLIYAYLNESVEDYNAAAINYLHAAWIFDDSRNIQYALKARQKAASSFLKLEDGELSVTNLFQTLDLLRRTKQFDKALEFLEPLEEVFNDRDIFHVLVLFQKELIKNKDSEEYRTKDAMDFVTNDKN